MNIKIDIDNDFTDEAIAIIRSMCMPNQSTDGLIIAGSSSLKNMNYPNDIDLHQIVDVSYKTKDMAKTQLVYYFRKMILNLKELPNVYITDIKFGSIDEYKILDDGAYNYDSCMKKLNILHEKNVINDEEFQKSKKLLTKRQPTLKQYFEMKDMFKFNIVRMDVNDILNGYAEFRNQIWKLSDLITTGLVKVDIIAYINNKYTEVSNIYEFKNNNKMLSPEMTNLDDSIKEDIMYNFIYKNYFKMAKRMYAMTDANQGTVKNELTDLFNSQLGIIYNVLSDIKVLMLLIEKTGIFSHKKVRNEINMFKTRLVNVYSVHSFMKDPEDITNIIDKLSKYIGSKDFKSVFYKELSILMKKFETILNENTKNVLQSMKLLPLPKKYKL